MQDKPVVNRFTLDDPDLDLLDLVLPEDKLVDEQRSERWPDEAAAANTLK